MSFKPSRADAGALSLFIGVGTGPEKRESQEAAISPNAIAKSTLRLELGGENTPEILCAVPD
jgi:hypothetical protein